MDFIIYPKPNNSVVFMIPTGEIPIEEVASKDVPAGLPFLYIAREDVPVEHDDLFDAWEADFSTPGGIGAITVSLEKAKEIWKEKLRLARVPLLAAQDIAYQRALEQGLDTSDIVTEKQRLRDITNLVDAATSLSTLKAISVA